MIILIGGSVGGLAAIAVDDPIELRIAGLDDGRVLMKADAEQLAIEIEASGIGASDISVTLNGTSIDLERTSGSLVARPGALFREGVNDIEVRVDGRFVFDDLVLRRRVVAMLTAPVLAMPTQALRPADRSPVVIRGLIDDAVSLEIDGVLVAVDGGGFSVEVPATTQAVTVRAVHANGNATERVLTVVDAITPATYPETRGVHVSAQGWADPNVRGAILALAVEGSINAVELDIKDESGEVGYLSGVELANLAESTRSYYVPSAAIDELHDVGVRVIGRVVCFLDPILADWAWTAGRRDMVVQSGDAAGPLDSDYGLAAFTNYASPDVQRYLIELSLEAARAGFDEILYDYVRRPEGDSDSMTVPGLTRPPEVEIARFVRDANTALGPYEVELGVSVFGIAASRPGQTAQDIRLLAPHVDYVAPMVYPSHWGAGEYGVADPIRQPADIVDRSVADFSAVVAGSNAAIVPWLQAFSENGVDYGPEQVQTQINAAMEVGSSGFLLWNADSVYDPAALAASP